MVLSATALNKPEIIDRALGYPYDIRDSSFTLHRGRAVAFEPMATADRRPVIAIGSNRAPQQLKRKFGDNETVPVQHGRLYDHDVVHSAHLSSYGAVPATLRHVTSTEVHVAIAWLTSMQLEIMHKTELPHGNYEYIELRNIRLETEHGETVSSAFVYQSTRGHLADADGAPFALAEVRASRRRLRAISQRQALEHARAIAAPHRELHDFIHITATNRDERHRHIEVLRRAGAAPAHWPHARTVIVGYKSS